MATRKVNLVLEIDWDDYDDVSDELIIEDTGILNNLKDGVSVYQIDDWIPLSEQKPEPQTMVLAKIDRGEGKTWVILAKFIPARTVLAEDFFEDYEEDDMDYDKENDQYYVPETWVECSWFGSDLMFHSEPVIEWKPI